MRTDTASTLDQDCDICIPLLRLVPLIRKQRDTLAEQEVQYPILCGPEN